MNVAAWLSIKAVAALAELMFIVLWGGADGAGAATLLPMLISPEASAVPPGASLTTKALLPAARGMQAKLACELLPDILLHSASAMAKARLLGSKLPEMVNCVRLFSEAWVGLI